MAWLRRRPSTSTSPSSWVVGDSDADIGLARAVGARPLYVGASHRSSGPTWPPSRTCAAPYGSSWPTSRVEPADGPARRSPTPVRRRRCLRAAYASEFARAFGTVDLAQIARAAEVLNDAHDRDAAVFACGNGGSASIANHLQCDHVKGVPQRHRPAHAGVQPQHEHRAAQRDRQRPQLRRGLRLPAAVTGPRRRCAARRLLVGPVTEHRPRAGVGQGARACATIALTGFYGGAARELADVSHPRRLATTTASSRTPTRRACTCSPSTSASRA